MTAATVPAALTQASQLAGLEASDATPLREHATGVWLLPRVDAVARIGRADTADRAEVSLIVANWLVAEAFPAPEPLTVQPIAVDDAVVTFWRYYPQPDAADRPPVAELGNLLRQLHNLGEPPITLDEYQPLAELTGLLDGDDAAVLPRAERDWLAQRASSLIESYSRLDSALGMGLVHGDAYPGNLLWGPDRTVLLGDWDEVSIAPRELDLTNTYQGIRFGRPSEVLDQFTAAYGYDVRLSPSFPTLREMRDLHTLGSFIRRAAKGDDAAEHELMHRLATLRAGADSARWHAA
ncbi:phosphotransferase [Nocardia sp. NPDC003726]